MVIFSSIFVTAILFICILGIASIGAMFSERAGIINIAINGNMIIGATTYGMFSQIFNVASGNIEWIIYPLAMLFGMLFCSLHGFICIKLKGNQIISGVALNLLAYGIALLFLQIFGTANRFNIINQELAWAQNPLVGQWGNILSLKTALLMLIVVGAWWALNKTKWGLRYCAVGENPTAADVAGINVHSYQWQGIVLSGAISSLAGAIFGSYIKSNFAANVQGMGFLALAILIMGQWRVLLILLAASVFGFLQATGAVLGTGVGSLAVLAPYKYVFYIMPYLLTIVILAATSKKSAMPKALGKPYLKA